VSFTTNSKCSCFVVRALEKPNFFLSAFVTSLVLRVFGRLLTEDPYKG